MGVVRISATSLVNFKNVFSIGVNELKQVNQRASRVMQLRCNL